MPALRDWVAAQYTRRGRSCSPSEVLITTGSQQGLDLLTRAIVDPGDDVVILLSTNPGAPAAPLAKVASGGELARTMLALRLVLSEAPDTLVFDEVDAGVGGTAATAVGRALADIAVDHQVMVVTHLPQVAAFGARQLVVSKATRKGETHVSVLGSYASTLLVMLKML